MSAAPGAGVAAGPSPRRLTEEQERAAERRAEPLLLSAAAGSGKTLVLVERFVRAVRSDGVAPGRILAITFTERAAGELRERVRARLLELGEREAARDTEAAFVGTFHSFCARVLRAHAPAAGLDPEFTILDEGLSGRLRDRAMRLALADLLRGERAEAVDVVAAYRVDRVAAMIGSVHAQLRSRGQRVPRLPELRPREGGELEEQALAACGELDLLLAAFGRAYEQLKRERGAVDFDDLELIAGELLTGDEAVRASWSGRFELLMVDEFQDTNPRQLAILRALDRGNLFTVGDELQSIYGFRHADVSLFRGRRAELEAVGASLALTHNFRSAPAVLEIVNTLFSERFEGFTPLVPARAGGEQEPHPHAAVELLISDREGWDERPELARELANGMPSAAPWRLAEAHALAARVAEMVQVEGVPAGDIVVLLRAGGDLRVYERALTLRGLRTLAAIGAFWEHQQVGDLIAYLRALANPLDELALYGVLASALVALSSDALALLAGAAREQGRGLWHAACSGAAPLSEREAAALSAFCRSLGQERESAQMRPLSDLIERAVQAASYRAHILSLEGGERRLANIHKLLRVARRFEAAEGRDLRGFLDHVTHLSSSAGAREAEAPVDGADPDAVRLMSIHAAKGLEFPVVCLADLGRAPNNAVPDLLVDGDRVGLRLALLDGERARPALEFEQLAVERAEREAEEEDRILYVAMTRARERLLLSGAAAFGRWADASASAGPISWLGPALVPDLPVRMQSEPRPLYDLQLPGGARLLCALGTPAGAGPAAQAAPAGAASGLTPSRSEPEPEAPRPPAATGAGSLSYTALSELERCGYRYYLQRVLGLPERAARGQGAEHGLSARDRGTLVHRLLETADFVRPEPLTERDVARAARDLGMRAADPERREIARLLTGALRSPMAHMLAGAQDVRREYPFAFSPGSQEPLITGVVDVLATVGHGRMLVVDYKSDRVDEHADLDEIVERDYAIQRQLYGLAVLRSGAQEVQVAHWFLARPGEHAEVRYTQADRPMLEAALAERLSHAHAGEYAVSPRPHRGLCLTCPGRGGMCSWGDEQTLRDNPEGQVQGASALNPR
jgi:ATP-dependent exoDNAse (exonuclease V) beta subunit